MPAPTSSTRGLCSSSTGTRGPLPAPSISAHSNISLLHRMLSDHRSNRGLLHQPIVDQLKGLGRDAELAPVGIIHYGDEAEHGGGEERDQSPKCALKPMSNIQTRNMLI